MIATSNPSELLKFAASGGTIDADDVANYSPTDRHKIKTAATHIAELRESGANALARRHAREAASSIGGPAVKDPNDPGTSDPRTLAALVTRH